MCSPAPFHQVPHCLIRHTPTENSKPMSNPTKAQSPALMQVSNHLPGPATSLIYRLLLSPVCCSHLLDLQINLGTGERHTDAADLKEMGVSGAEPWPTFCYVAAPYLVILMPSPSMAVRRTSRQGPLLNLRPSSPLPNPPTCLLWPVTDNHVFLLFPLFIAWQDRKASQTSDCIHSK